MRHIRVVEVWSNTQGEYRTYKNSKMNLNFRRTRMWKKYNEGGTKSQILEILI